MFPHGQYSVFCRYSKVSFFVVLFLRKRTFTHSINERLSFLDSFPQCTRNKVPVLIFVSLIYNVNPSTFYLFRSKVEELIEGLCLVQSTLSSSCNVSKDGDKQRHFSCHLSRFVVVYTGTTGCGR